MKKCIIFFDGDFWRVRREAEPDPVSYAFETRLLAVKWARRHGLSFVAQKKTVTKNDARL